MRILVVKMSSMGDIVHAQPIVADIHAAIPGAVVDWVCEAPFAAIPAMNPGVSSVIPIAWRKWRRKLGDPATRAAMHAFRDRLRETRYDWVIDCQGLLKSAAVARLARSTQRAGHAWSSAREPLASLAYDVRARVPRSLHVVARNRGVAAAAIGCAVSGPARFGLTAPAFAPPWLASESPPYAVLIPGASRAEKLWPQAHWVETARWLADRGLRLVWLWGSAEERERVLSLAAACGSVDDASGAGVSVDKGSDASCVRVTGGATTMTGEAGSGRRPGLSVIPPFLSVADAAGLLAGAHLVIGLDTGFTHLAGALGRPTVGIFCDFDATQCAVSGDGPCASLGGVGMAPSVASVCAAFEPMLDTLPAPGTPFSDI